MLTPATTSAVKFLRKERRKISVPAEVLPCWRARIRAEGNNPAIHDALWFGSTPTCAGPKL